MVLHHFRVIARLLDILVAFARLVSIKIFVFLFRYFSPISFDAYDNNLLLIKI